MNRTQRRLAEKQRTKIREEQMNKRLDQIKKQATNEALNSAFVLLMAIPLKVASEKYQWSDEDLEGFANDIVEEYRDFQSGELSIEELQNLVFDKAGLKFEYR